jgi:hypothetical protein
MQAKQKTKKLEGFGGWLILLSLSLTLLGPIKRALGLKTEITNIQLEAPAMAALAAWSDYKMVAWSIVLGTCALSIVAGIRLWASTSRGVPGMAIVALWVAGPLASLSLIAAGSWFFNLRPSALLATGAGIELLYSAVASVAWTLYLFFSKRVQNTYRGPRAAA